MTRVVQERPWLLALVVAFLVLSCETDSDGVPGSPAPTASTRSEPTSSVEPISDSPTTASETSPGIPTIEPTVQVQAEEPVAGEQVRVARIVDGDTVELGDGGTVRLIGVDTPETVAPGQPVDCYGPEASAYTKQLLEGQTVFLEKDVSETDRFGRLLRYVYLESGEMVNELLVLDGYARVSTFPPDVKYQERFLAAERQAREAGRGLWGPVCVPTAVPTAAPAPQPTQPPSQGGNCDPAYPTVCIPSPPPDLDCGDIPHRRFTVLPPDPHRFDGNDNDGIGCESG
jgi:micrococcal nuclease